MPFIEMLWHNMQGCARLREAANCISQATFKLTISRIADWKTTENTRKGGHSLATGSLSKVLVPIQKQPRLQNTGVNIQHFGMHGFTHLLQASDKRSRNAA